MVFGLWPGHPFAYSDVMENYVRDPLLGVVSRILLVGAGWLAGVDSAKAEVPEPAAALSRISFTTDVVPILTKLGCNSGGCHGKSTGQNGFKLSLLGFVPSDDHESMVKEARGRRVFAGDPSGSLLLQKATGRVPHGGGRRLDFASADYGVLSEWIRQGAAGPRAGDPIFLLARNWSGSSCPRGHRRSTGLWLLAGRGWGFVRRRRWMTRHGSVVCLWIFAVRCRRSRRSSCSSRTSVRVVGIG